MRKSRRHTSVSWGSLPSSVSETSEAEEEERRGVSSEQCDTDLTLLSTLTPPRPSLVLQQSTDSDATTADTGQGVPRRVINISTDNFIHDHCLQDTSQMPIATALFVATCLGTPAIALTGLKLGMFAAVGGGIMGFATGKMFAEHE